MREVLLISYDKFIIIESGFFFRCGNVDSKDFSEILVGDCSKVYGISAIKR